MRSSLQILSVCVLAGGLGLGGLPRSAGAQAPTIQTPISAQNESGESGVATLEAMGSQTKVTLNIPGVPAGANQPAHIHEGTCATLNPAPAFPLSNVQGANTETTVDVPLEMLLASPHAINVHRSPTEVPVYVACSDIAVGGAGQPMAAEILISAQNNSGESGFISLEAMGNQTRVTVRLAGVPAGANQPAHIHEGTCATLNPAPAFPLNNVRDADTETIVDVPLSTLMASPYAINVHRSPTEVPVYVACGDITTGGMSMATPGDMR